VRVLKEHLACRLGERVLAKLYRILFVQAQVRKASDKKSSFSIFCVRTQSGTAATLEAMQEAMQIECRYIARVPIRNGGQEYGV
jgi:hypothetical protein